MSEMPPLNETVVYDTHGSEVPVASLWSDRPAVMVFLRHYG